MPVTERLMLPGQWSLTLVPATPYKIRSAMKFYGQIVILDSMPDGRLLDDANILKAARYTGIVRKRETPYHLGGLGLIAYLGDDKGKGAYLETTLTLTTRTFVQAVGDLLTAAVPAGSLHAIGVGTITQGFQGMTNAKALDTIMSYFGGEFRVRPDGKLDAGVAGDLFTTTPTAIAARIGGRESSLKGLHAPNLGYAQDAEDYSNRVFVTGAAGATAAANGPATPYKDLFGNALVMTRPVSSPASGANLATIATAQAALWAVLHQQVTLDSDNYDLPRDVKAGDALWVYDLASEITDTTNAGVRYRGELIRPMLLRCLGSTWPIERGMGVFYRDPTTTPATYTDLTRWVQPEPAGASLEVGAASRPLTF